MICVILTKDHAYLKIFDCVTLHAIFLEVFCFVQEQFKKAENA